MMSTTHPVMDIKNEYLPNISTASQQGLVIISIGLFNPDVQPTQIHQAGIKFWIFWSKAQCHEI